MESKFTFGKFKATDIVTMATMLSKIGLGKATDVFGKENIMKLIAENKDAPDATAYTGMAIAFQIADVVLGNLEKCQGELYTLLANISGMTVEEVKNLDAEDFFELIVETVQLDQFKDFIKVASRLFNTAK